MAHLSVVIVNTNELHHLRRCLPSIFAQDYDDFEVLIVDNNSTDGSVEYVQQNFPRARLVRNKENLGYAGANNAGFEHATGDYIMVLNPDTEAMPGFLSEMVRAMDTNPGAGLATCKILLMDQPHLINACGNDISYTGLTFCRGLDRPANQFAQPEVVSAVSGAAFVIRRSVLDEIGGFDESFFIYYEETDLSLRAMVAGYQVIYVPTAVILHNYAFRFSPKKCFYQERNRYYSMLKNLRWRTFLALLPGLLVSEMLAWGYAGLQGAEHVKSKFQSWIWLWQHWGQIMDKRRQVQRIRRVDDRILLKRFSHRLNFAQTTKPWIASTLEAILNPLLLVISKATTAIVYW